MTFAVVDSEFNVFISRPYPWTSGKCNGSWNRVRFPGGAHGVVMAFVFPTKKISIGR